MQLVNTLQWVFLSTCWPQPIQGPGPNAARFLFYFKVHHHFTFQHRLFEDTFSGSFCIDELQ